MQLRALTGFEMTQSTEISIWNPLGISIFRHLWLASLVSNLGTWMQNLGGVWLMTSLSPSPLFTALMQTATSLPVFFVVLPAGALADVVDRRRFLLVTQGWMLLAAAGLSVVTFLGMSSPWILLGFTFALGLGAAMNMPAWQAIMPDLVPRNDLPAAIALNSMTFNLARSIGPAVGGIVVAAMGPAYVFLINALSFVGVLAVIYFWKETPKKVDSPPEQVIGAIQAGLRYLFNSSSLPRILGRSFLFIISAGALWALLPVVVRKELNWDSTGFGLLLGSLGVGALMGASVMPFLRNRCGVNFLLISASLVFALGTLALAQFRSPVALIPALLFSGAAWTITMSNFNVAVQTTSPSWVRARALSFYTLVFQGGLALSGVMWGFISDYLNVTLALSAAAMVLLLTLVPGIKRPLEQGSELDLSPSMHWPEPELVVEPQPNDGPLLVTVEYTIKPGTENQMYKLLFDIGKIRRRNGAMDWNVYQDLASPQQIVETFTVVSWAEHVRQHHRVTLDDKKTEEKLSEYFSGENPIKIRHLISGFGRMR